MMMFFEYRPTAALARLGRGWSASGFSISSRFFLIYLSRKGHRVRGVRPVEAGTPVKHYPTPFLRRPVPMPIIQGKLTKPKLREMFRGSGNSPLLQDLSVLISAERMSRPSAN